MLNRNTCRTIQNETYHITQSIYRSNNITQGRHADTHAQRTHMRTRDRIHIHTQGMTEGKKLKTFDTLAEMEPPHAKIEPFPFSLRHVKWVYNPLPPTM